MTTIVRNQLKLSGSNNLNLGTTMKRNKTTHRLIPAALAMAGALILGHSACAQALYVGETRNDTVEGVEVTSGTYLGPFIHSSNEAQDYKLAGPRGAILVGAVCIVINQNVNLPVPGEVLKYAADTGEFIPKLVPSSLAHAPFAPRSVIAIGNTLYMADMGHFDEAHPGQVVTYNLADGQFLGQLETTGFDKIFAPRGLACAAAQQRRTISAIRCCLEAGRLCGKAGT